MNNYKAILYTVKNRVATITLNRPKAMNAFDAVMRRELLAAIIGASSDDSVRAVVLTGAGRAFSAGADLIEPMTENYLPQIQLEDEYKPAVLAITQAPKPFISAINGIAAGAASGYAMACDLTLMADDACIYQAFGAIGLIPDTGATWQLVEALGRKRAYEFITSGERVSAQRCLELGLANRVVPAAELMAAAQEWAEGLADKAPLALKYAKQSVAKMRGLELADAISYEAALQNRLVRSADSREGISAFMEKRKPKFLGY